MLKGESIICFANDWFEDPTSKHHVMRLLSAQNKVLWVNSISMRPPKINAKDMSRIWKKIKEYFKGIVSINNNLFVYTPLVLPFPHIRIIRLFNSLVLKLHLNYYKWKLGMKDVIIITFLPNVNEIIDRLKPKKLVYYCVDDWSNFTYIDTNTIIAEEQKLLSKASLVLATSKKLFDDKKDFNSNIYYLSHGVDFEHFNKALLNETKVPDDINSINGPIIGFFGLIHDWIDVGLMAKVAQKYPKVNVIMIGEVLVDIEKYKSIKNLIFLGKKQYSELPGYCKKFDVAVMPFIINELPLSVNPIKLREYMSAALPVLSTPLPEAQVYNDQIYIEEGDAFVEKVGEIIKNLNDPKYRGQIELMKKETWDSKVDYLSDLINKIN